jgi:hypothetical protein
MQVALYCLRNAHKLKKFFDPIEIDEVSYEGWVRGIASGRLWGDETVLTVISHMWNVAISVITPLGVYDIYHTKNAADIYIIANGPMGGNLTSHFSGTGNFFYLD